MPENEEETGVEMQESLPLPSFIGYFILQFLLIKSNYKILFCSLFYNFNKYTKKNLYL